MDLVRILVIKYMLQDLRDFMTSEAVPLVVEFNHETAKQIFKPPNNQEN